MTDIDTLWDFNDPALSEGRFREALANCSASLDAAEVRTQIARTLGLRGRFDDAAHELDRAEALIGDGASRAKTRLLLERGRCLNSAGNPNAAIPYFESAVETAADCGEPGLEIDAIHMLAIADTVHALEWNLKGIEMAEASPDQRAKKWRASLYNNTGWTYFDSGDPKTALEYFEKAVPLREAMGDKGNLNVAKWCVARTLRELGRAGDALSIVSGLIESDPDDAYNNQEYALCLVAVGRASEASPYAEKALGRLRDDPWMKENRAEVLEALETASRG